MVKRIALALLLASCASAVACSLVFPVPDARPDAPTTDGAVAGEGAADAGGPDVGVTVTCVQTGRGPLLVPAGTRACIDATPVTRDQYAEFAKSAPIAGQIAGCENNKSWTPLGHADSGAAPVDGVDWCDAWAFCDWAGKTLCGTFPGTTAPPLEDAGKGVQHGIPTELVSDRDASVYTFACQGGDLAYNYPYGYDVDATQCYRDPSYGTATPPEPGPVGSTGCAGGFPGIVDLVGLQEWVDACNADRCQVAGEGTCRGSSNIPAWLTSGIYPMYIGRVTFRCCGRTAPSIE